MCLSNKQLDKNIANRDLIAISRAELNSIKLQGFPLAYSADLLLVRYVFDFYLDGLLLIRRRDITDSYSRKTDEFQRDLLAAENKLKDSLFKTNYPIESFDAFLQNLPSHEIVSIENESIESSKFYIGRFLSADKRAVTIQEFTGAGNWEGQVTKIPNTAITCCQIKTNYINFYSRYFKRTSQ